MSLWRWTVRVGLLVAAAIVLSSCHGGPHLTFVVNTTSDLADASPGDGVCEATAGAGDCTFRAAIEEANALVNTDVEVVLSPGTTYDANGSVPAVTGVVHVAGNGATLDGGFAPGAVVSVSTGTLVVDDVTVAYARGLGQDAYGAGLIGPGTLKVRDSLFTQNDVGIRQLDGSLTVVGTEFYRNGFDSSIVGYFPGPALALEGGTADIVGVLIHENIGPAISQSGGAAVVANSTITDQVFSYTQQEWCGMGMFCPVTFSQAEVGVSQSGGSLALIATTITDASTAITTSSGGVSLVASAVDAQDGDPSCSGVLTSGGYNVVADATCVDGSVVGDQPSTALGLGPLADNGGPTATLLPGLGSALLDAVPTGVGICDGSLPFDQRNEPRPSGTNCDVGAVERQPTDP